MYKLLSNLMNAMITGANLDSPTVQIKPFVAQMNYTVKPTDGSKQLLKYLPSLQKQIDKVGLKYSFPRPGFAVVVKNHPDPHPKLSPHADRHDKAYSTDRLSKPRASRRWGSIAGTRGCRLESIDPTAAITASLESLFKNLDYSALSVDASFPYCLYSLEALPFRQS